MTTPPASPPPTRSGVRRRAPGTLSRTVLAGIWLVLGAAMVATTVWIGWTRWEPVLNGHPAMLATAIVAGLLGLVAITWAVATLAIGARQDAWAETRGQQRLRTTRQLERRARLRIVLAVPALLVCLLTVVALAWARPFPASAQAIADSRSHEGVRASDTLTWYELAPAAQDENGQRIEPTVGLVFTPGARVDPRAYATILSPLAAEGYLVIVLRDPFDLAVLDPNHAGRAMAVHPEITSWVVAGHSLGGVMAADFADRHPEVKGLALWASYPNGPLQRSDLAVVSISGSADGLATPAKIAASKPDLPASTTYVVVEGGVHAYFGDYGTQPGDGLAATDRATAQQQIRQATEDLLVAVTPPPKKK